MIESYVRVKFNAESEPLKPWEDSVQKITMRMQGSWSSTIQIQKCHAGTVCS